MIIRGILITFLFFIISNYSFSQFGNEFEVTGTVYGASDVHLFDIDGDGDLDVFSASANDGKIAWYENFGNGELSRQWVIERTQVKPNDLEFADMDNDGDMDIVVTCNTYSVPPVYLSGRIFWIENLGSNQWGPKQLIVSNINPEALALADVNGDSNIDIVYPTGNFISWIANLGGGSFAAAIDLFGAAVGDPSDVAVEDMDGDLDLDIVLTAYGGNKVMWHENLSPGTFSVAQTISTGMNGASALYLSDLNNDGVKDILVASELDDKISWFANLGGFFGPEQVVSTNMNEVTAVHAADLDNDGDQDIFTGSWSNSLPNMDSIFIFENLGTGTFGPGQGIGLFEPVNFLTTGDVDGDGNLDLLGAFTSIDSRVSWMQNLGGLSLGPEKRISSNVHQVEDIENVDLDCDGDLDVLAAYFDGVAWFENEGNDIYSSRKDIYSLPYAAVLDVTTGDMDGDGDPDIVYSMNALGYEIAWQENLGGGNFGVHQTIANGVTAAPYSVFVADMDTNGWNDVLVASRFDATVSLFLNSGGGNFSSQIEISTVAGGAMSVVAADLDGDIDLDVVSGNNIPNEVAWYENLGDTIFGNLQSLTTSASNVEYVTVADIDDDGDIDILSASHSDNKIAWYENFGGGMFSSQQIIAFGHGVNEIEVEDIDEDGDLDIVGALYGGGRVSWYENLGGMNFSGENVIINITQPRSLSLGDADKDGDFDVFTVERIHGEIVGLHNGLYSTVRVSGELYVDLNQNDVRDSAELGMPQLGVISTSLSDFTFTNSDGTYLMNFSDTLGAYQLFPQTPQYWNLTTDSLLYNIFVDSVFTVRDSLDFGFFPDTIITSINVDLAGGYPLCSSQVDYWLDFGNIGT
ncbi:MAG: FG-GAP repeat domain-containing protein, partial [Crocinitomicaceae bacterium]